MGFHVIVAYDNERGIGLNGDLPWHLPGDMAFFKKTTSTTIDPKKKNAVIMGRTTWESIPERFRPLEGRYNVVLSKTMTDCEHAALCTSLVDALSLCYENRDIETVFVIGGASVYEQALEHPDCESIYATQLFQRFDCDRFFPSCSAQFEARYASNVYVTSTANYAFFRYHKREI